MRRARRGAWSWAWLGAGTLSCSLLVSGEPEPLRCAMEGHAGPPACDEGLVCSGGICRPDVAESGAGGDAGASGAAD